MNDTNKNTTNSESKNLIVWVLALITLAALAIVACCICCNPGKIDDSNNTYKAFDPDLIIVSERIKLAASQDKETTDRLASYIGNNQENLNVIENWTDPDRRPCLCPPGNRKCPWGRSIYISTKPGEKITVDDPTLIDIIEFRGGYILRPSTDSKEDVESKIKIIEPSENEELEYELPVYINDHEIKIPFTKH